MSLFGFRARAAGIDVGDDRHAGHSCASACLKPLTRSCTLVTSGSSMIATVPLFPTACTDQLAGLEAALHVVAGDVRDDLALVARARDVGGKDRDVRVVRLDDRAADRLRIVRRQTIASTFFEMKSSTWLCCLALSRFASTTIEVVAVFCGLRAHAGFHVLIELRFAILNRNADRLAARSDRRATGRSACEQAAVEQSAEQSRGKTARSASSKVAPHSDLCST